MYVRIPWRWGFFIPLIMTLWLPYLATNPDFIISFDLFNSEFSEFHFNLIICFISYFAAFMFYDAFSMYFGWFIKWVYCFSVSRIYSKPRRVYPVEKQKFFSLY